MKCVEMNGVVVKVKNEEAVKMVKNGGKYVAKKFLKDDPKPATNMIGRYLGSLTEKKPNNMRN